MREMFNKDLEEIKNSQSAMNITKLRLKTLWKETRVE